MSFLGMTFRVWFFRGMTFPVARTIIAESTITKQLNPHSHFHWMPRQTEGTWKKYFSEKFVLFPIWNWRKNIFFQNIVTFSTLNKLILNKLRKFCWVHSFLLRVPIFRLVELEKRSFVYLLLFTQIKIIILSLWMFYTADVWRIRAMGKIPLSKFVSVSF